jgi:hypothetical protein
MKKVVSITFLLISLNTFSQHTKQYAFDSFYHKLKTYYPYSKSNYGLTIKQFTNTFSIESDITYNQQFTKIEVMLTDEFDFVGERIYEYRGFGYLFGTTEVSVIIESKMRLSEFIKGKGYELNSNVKRNNYEIKVYYWDYRGYEPLAKKSIAIYPIKNLSAKQREEQDYQYRKIVVLERNFHNINDYITGFTKKMSPTLEKSAVEILSNDNFEFKKQSQIEIKGTYNIRLSAKKEEEYATVQINEEIPSSNYSTRSLKHRIRIKLPIINSTLFDKEYELNREANFVLKYDVVVGIAIIKNRGSKINFKSENTLTEIQKAVISKFFTNKRRGTYHVKYQIGSINDTDATIINAERQESKFHIGY